MTIEFNCPHCEKLLRTADDKAGVQANCPGCGQLVTVPSAASAPVADEFSGLPPYPGATGQTQTCPMCGAMNSAGEPRCKVCGETFAGNTPTGVITNRILDVGTVLNVSWNLYKARMGLCIGSVAIMWGIIYAISIVTEVVKEGMKQTIGGGGRGGDIEVMIGVFAVFMWLVQQLVTIYLTLGQVNLMLKIVRGEVAQIGDMFSVGRFYWRSLWASVLYFVMVLVGYALLIIPGIIVSIMFFPYNLYLVDQDTGIIASLEGARRVTEGNRLTIFVLMLIATGINFLGVLACCVGVLFTGSWTALMSAVAYQMATGRSVARA